MEQIPKEIEKLLNLSISKREIIKEFGEYVSLYKKKFFKKIRMDIVMGERNGIYFYDQKGKRYINCHCNGGVFNLGHRNQEVIEAVEKALKVYDIGNHHLISGPRAILAKNLIKTVYHGKKPKKKGIKYVIYGASGGESIDTAIKLALGYTRKHKIISIKGAYHGHTGLAVLTGDEKYKKPFNIDSPHFVQIPFGDLNALENAIDEDTAAFIIETIPATLGIRIPTIDYMKGIRKITQKKGIVLIIDEVQTGLGRTGKFWGFHHYDIEPDIIVSGKGLSGGIYPITAVMFKKDFMKLFKKDPFIHISTFGGSEIGCFAALKVLEISSQKGFLENVEELGNFFKEELENIIKNDSDTIEFRGLGLFMGIVFKDFATNLVFLKILAKNGIFAVYSNNDKKVMQLLPPLVITREEAKKIIDIIKHSLIELKSLKNRILIKLVRRIFGND